MTVSRRGWITKGSRHGYNADVDGYLSSSSLSSSSMSRQESDLPFREPRQFYDKRPCFQTKATSFRPKPRGTSTTATSSVSSLTSLDANGDSRRGNDIRFYATIEPRRRGTKKNRGDSDARESRKRRFRCGARSSSASTANPGNGHVHPDIDLSLVSLLSSKEHDRRQLRRVKVAMSRGIIPRNDAFEGLSGLGTRGGSCHGDENFYCAGDESSTSLSSSCSSLKSDSSWFSREGDIDDGNIDEEDRVGNSRDPGSRTNENKEIGTGTTNGNDEDNVLNKSKSFAKKFSFLTSSRPLAVIDYGSIQFGKLEMTGSLLDSIYQIGSGNNGGEASNLRKQRKMQDIMDEKWNCKSDDLLSQSNKDNGRDNSVSTDINEKIQFKDSVVGTSASPPPTLGPSPILPPVPFPVPTASAKKACVATLKPPRPSSELSRSRSRSHPAMSQQSRPTIRATVASCRTPQVDAVIQSLKMKNSSFGSLQVAVGTHSSKESTALLSTKRKTAEDLYALDRREGSKRRKESMEHVGDGCVMTKHVPIPILFVDRTTTTLEDAISFSPYARLLIDARAPHIILHSNAAYSSLVNKGLVNSCIVGQAILDRSKGGETDDEPSSMFISHLVARHIGMIGDHDLHHLVGNSNNGSRNDIHPASNRRQELWVDYHSRIFPVLSDGKTFKDLIRSFQHHDASRTSLLYPSVSERREHFASLDTTDRDHSIHNLRNTNHLTNPTVNSSWNRPTLPLAKKSIRARRTKHSTSLPTGLHVSHYLLQIEPMSQIPKCTL